MMWMNLEPIINSEVNQKEENKYHILMQPRFLGFPDVSQVKNPFTMQETQETRVQSLDQENPLEEEMATHYRIPA